MRLQSKAVLCCEGCRLFEVGDCAGAFPDAVALPALAGLAALHGLCFPSAGTAGGFRSRGAAIADVFVSTGMVNHDRRIPIPVSRCCC